MKVDLGLQVAANAFIDAVAPLLETIVRHTPGGDPSTARADVTLEAWELACAFIDADRRASDEELWALIVAFAPTFDPTLLQRTPDDLRRDGVTEGRRHWLHEPSELFALLVDVDERQGTDYSTIYYQHAVALGFMVASLDDYTSRDELLAIEHVRGQLLAAIRAGHVRRRDDGPTGTGPGAAHDRHDTGTGNGHTTAATATGGAPAAAETPADAPPPPRPLDELLGELDDLVGMQPVKDEVKLVTNLIRVQQLRRQRNLPVQEQSRHLIFTGNPGTGKTTVARLLAQIYRTLGVVERGHLVETDRSGLVAGYVGQTATKVVAVFDEADQGVLLIDEAYALVRGSEQDFGREAIDAIVKLVEDRRDRVVVIAAGYPDEMGDFVRANPGLPSRFPRTILFPDYTTDELARIFESLCTRGHYRAGEGTTEAVRRWLEAQPRTKGFGNGRLVRNLFEQAVARQASRVVALAAPTDDELVTLLPADVPDLPALPDLPDLPDLPVGPDAAPAGSDTTSAD
ncbi:MAG: AAA family ATPase [Acidimicrobiales bacterium]|nr:AAA family ATPase [Acidimicrobiales bacterium]